MFWVPIQFKLNTACHVVACFTGIADLNGDAIRNDDGASFYTHSNNVVYAPKNPGVQFNGGTQIYSIGNLYLLTGAGLLLASVPDVAGIFNDTVVDALPHGLFNGACDSFYRNSPEAKIACQTRHLHGGITVLECSTRQGTARARTTISSAAIRWPSGRASCF